MKPLVVSLLLFVPFALGARYYFVCETLQWCEVESAGTSASPGLVVALPSGQETTVGYETYRRGALRPTRSLAHLAALDSLAAIALATPEYDIELSGPYAPDEPASTPTRYRDLGLARAADLSRELQRRGVSGDRFELSSYRVDSGAPLAMRFALSVAGPAFDRGSAPAPEELLDSTALLGLRFESNSTALTPNDDLTAYAYDLIDALGDAPTRRLRLIGHTDNRAERAFNDSLGLWRAQAVARYLEQLGYPREITVETKGERQPIADNATAEGRYLNRRVEVRID